MNRLLAGLTLLLLVLAGGWWFTREPPPAAVDERPIATPRRSVAPASNATPSDSPRAQRLRDGAAARATKLRLITEAIAAREAAQKLRDPATTPPTTSRTKPATTPTDEPAALPTALPTALPPMQDRTGNHAYLARVLNQDLLPLVDECEQLARVKHPELAGLLNLNVEILGDEDIGGVIDALEPAANNEVADPELLECVRESLLATTLPAPDQGGRDALMLSLRIGPEPGKPANDGG